ncbi:MAG: glycosyltransferase family 4 protein [Actinobacteria bacterium]|nr:glycosyltransferase family 4 protein [Actinomycetota bacterium]
MDVCVCGAQAPFVHGGAELHMDNLVRALRDAGHRAELVRLPTAWDKVRVFDSALAWRFVPVDADVVIATNFPSYFVRHPRKVVWLFHQHRNAYDAVDAPWSDYGLDEESLEAQRLLIEWDTRALREAEALFTTSGVVADRLARFNGLEGEPLYHPPPLFESLHPGDIGNYVFCPTRLESNKRPTLLTDAMAHVRAPTRLVLAGRGTLEGELRARVADRGLADRVELTGFVSDAQLIDLYAGALTVVYAPFDEDYGYVTLQAFRAGKPVITTHDAGGVLEWVEDGVTGFVTDPSPEALGEAVARLVSDPALAQRMGDKARARVAELSWGPVVTRLLGR